jgi:predicted alpha/beta hydrolase family esterase
MAVIADAPLRVLLLPGWLDSGPGHWQSHWEGRPGFQRVQQADWQWPRRGDWMAQLEEAVLAAAEPGPPLLLAAHSLGCHLVAAWAAHSGHADRVRGALLVAAPDTTRADLPPQLAGWRHGVHQLLPFAAQAVISSDDPYCSPERGRSMAAEWGAPVLELPGAGHINADSGLGAWPQGLALLHRLALGRP